ncbi:hypothetical protein MS3_00007666 [Schistosoma haematobium]|uniref:Uncharacterized protein n=2 Tax=Schistosoma haematobium TaxID=6185 RepID=A0A6A5CUY8_SCHHA|nr:hypothetical protein MS3_00007666 [Schistosoma haematobium]KAH9583169.1 hypothetical protein MS3_00007666 [Schistosoma haematobium]CAH8585271.1 unnamed protein product [Schistosoma haematobium]CAH8592464.1 unnamed protein product [Schistosoma haematobium]
MSSTSQGQNLGLAAKLVGPSVYSGGDFVNCEITFPGNSDIVKEEYKWLLTGIVGCIIGQCKLDNRQLTTQNQASPKSLSFSTSEWKYNCELNFDAESLFISTLESKSQLICIIPMHVKFIPDNSFKGPANLCAYLPYNLSPSIRGTLFKFAYKVVVAVQVKYLNSDIKTHTIQLPLRVLPSSIMYHSLRLQECDDKKETYSPDLSNPFWVPDTRDKDSCFNFGFDGGFSLQSQQVNSFLFEDTETHTNKSVGQIYSSLSHNVSQCGNSNCSDHSPEKSNEVYIYPSSHMELMNLLACSPPANFVISTPRGYVGRLSFQRTLYCLGDMVRGYFDFNEAVVKCLSCVIRLESEERFMLHHENPFLLPNCGIKSRRNEVQNCSMGCLPLTKIGQPLCTNFQPLGSTQHTTWTDIKLYCTSKLLLPFTLPIPTNITPQFHSVSLTSPFISLDYRWRLHLELDLISDSSKNDLLDHFQGKSCVKRAYGTVWTIPLKLKTEKFVWDIPIQLVHSNPSVIDNLSDSLKYPVCISDI